MAALSSLPPGGERWSETELVDYLSIRQSGSSLLNEFFEWRKSFNEFFSFQVKDKVDFLEFIETTFDGNRGNLYFLQSPALGFFGTIGCRYHDDGNEISYVMKWNKNGDIYLPLLRLIDSLKTRDNDKLLYISVKPDNLRAISLYHKLGFSCSSATRGSDKLLRLYWVSTEGQ